jgi:hypothetical protein
MKRGKFIMTMLALCPLTLIAKTKPTIMARTGKEELNPCPDSYQRFYKWYSFQ